MQPTATTFLVCHMREKLLINEDEEEDQCYGLGDEGDDHDPHHGDDDHGG